MAVVGKEWRNRRYESLKKNSSNPNLKMVSTHAKVTSIAVVGKEQ